MDDEPKPSHMITFNAFFGNIHNTHHSNGVGTGNSLLLGFSNKKETWS